MGISESNQLLKQSVMERLAKIEIKTLVVWAIRRSLGAFKISASIEFEEGGRNIEVSFQRFMKLIGIR